MAMGGIVGLLMGFVIAHKWWLIALCPFAIAIMVLKAMSPR